jgi:predicted RNase H-like HicB family nuclease
MNVRELPVILKPGEDGLILAECPAFPACFSQGQTRDEALANIREVIELCLEAGEKPSADWELKTVSVST